MNPIKTTYEKLKNNPDIFEKTNELDDIEENIIDNENLGNDQIITTGPLVTLKDLGISFIEGMYCNYNPDTDEHEPDFGVTLIYTMPNSDDFDFNNYAYFEQDPPLIAIHNYLNAVGYESKTNKIAANIQLKQYAYAS